MLNKQKTNRKQTDEQTDGRTEQKPAWMTFVFLRDQEPDEVTITQLSVNQISTITTSTNHS